MKDAILVFGSFPEPHAVDRYVSGALAQRLSERGRKTILTSRSASRLLRGWDLLLSVWRERNHFGIAVVDVYSGPAFLWAEGGCALLNGLRKPYVLTLRGGNLPQFALRHPRRVRRLLQAAEVVTTPSGYLCEQMRPYCENLVLLPNAVDLGHYQFRLRQSPTSSLVWLRAFCEIYNPSLAVRVLAGVLKDFPQARLSMVGPDKGDGSLGRVLAETRKLKLGERVRLEGAVAKAEVPARLQAGDVFLNTTNYDNTPVSVIEAMACGLCVVSTNVGGMPYLLEHDKDGLLVPPNDEGAMVKAVVRVLKEPGLAARLSRNARAKAEQFDWSGVLPQWEALLFEVGAERSDIRPVASLST